MLLDLKLGNPSKTRAHDQYVNCHANLLAKDKF